MQIDFTVLLLKFQLNLFSDYRKSTIKAMAIMDHDKINIDLIESAIEWIVEGEHEVKK